MAKQDPVAVDEDPASDGSAGPLAPVIGLHVAALFMVQQARPQLVLQHTGGRAPAAAKILAAMSAKAAGVEFFLAPLLGGLSDFSGRLPLLRVALAAGFFRLLTAVRPGSIGASSADRVLSGALMTAAAPIANAILADIHRSPAGLISGMSGLAAASGLGLVFGSLTGGQLLSRFGPQAAFVGAAGVSGLALVLSCKLRETLGAPRPWHEFGPSAVSPLGFIKLLQHRPTRRLALVFAVQSLNDWSCLADTALLSLADRLGWSPGQVGQLMVALGGSLVANGALAPSLNQMLGPSRYTRSANLCSAGGWGLWASGAATGSSNRVWLALLMLALQWQKSLAINGQIKAAADGADGLSTGMVQANLSALGTLLRSIVPMLYAGLYRTQPPAAFVAAAAMPLLAELLRLPTPDDRDRTKKV